MSRIRPHLASALAAALLGALPAEGATLFRAYLSATGADTNPCTLPQPCRLLPAALAAVSEGGEIWMLDSANYNTGTVSIAKSVRILAIPGALGSVVAVNSAAIQVSGTVSVGLKNLTIVPLPPAVAGQVGISVTGAAEVTLEDCEIAGMPLAGIMASSGANLQITRSIVRDNGYVGVYLLAGSSATLAQSHVFGNASDGIFAYAGAPSTSVTVDVVGCTIDGNTNGVEGWAREDGSRIVIRVRASRLAGNSQHGIAGQADGTGTGLITASGNVVSNNGANGIAIYHAGMKAWVTGNTVSGNQVGLYNSAGTFESAGDNAVRNNLAGDTGGTITKPGTM